MLRGALLVVWAAVRCSASAAVDPHGLRPAHESAELEHPFKPGEGSLFKRSTRGLGVSALLQFLSYLPIKTTVDQPESWKGTEKLDELKEYVDRVLWNKTSHPGRAIVTVHDVAELFNHDDVTAFVEHLGNKDFSGKSAVEYKTQTQALTRMLREADKAESSGAPGFGLAYLQGQEKHIDGTFALLVDESAKRVILAFRGSQTGRDWWNNMYGIPGAELPVNNRAETFDGKKITVHRGFRDVLFRTDKKTGTTLFEQIKEQLRDNFPEEGQYSLSVTGHSQGGALATMVGFVLSKDEDVAAWMAKDKPVEIFSYASPPIGWKLWREAFQAAELGGTLRHLRFMGEDDPVPAIRGIANLEHCGARVVLNSAGIEDWTIDYPDVYNPDPKTRAIYKTDIDKHPSWNYLTRVKLVKKILHKFEQPKVADVFAELIKNHDKTKDNTYCLLSAN